MTQSVADPTPIPNKTWRQHTDPPGLWIVVIMGSVVLHLLLFWLMRSSEFARSQQHSSDAVPIEFIEISPKARAKARRHSKAKLVSPNPQSATRKSIPARLPNRVTQENFSAKSASFDRNTIAFANNKKASIPQRSEPGLPKKVLKTPSVKKKIAFFKPTPIKKYRLTPKLVTIPPPNIPDNIQPDPIPQPQTPIHRNRNPEPRPLNPNTNTLDQQTQASGEQNQPPLPLHNTTNLPDTTRPRKSSPLTSQPQEEPSPPVKNGEAIGEAPKNQIGEIPRTQTPHLTREPEQTPTRVGMVATWNVEVNGVQKDRPENLAKPIGSSREKDLNLLSLNSELNKPIDFQASLVIDSNGNLIDVWINPTIPEPQRTQYRKYTQEVFQGQKFIPATSSNGGKPPSSNLVVRLTIQPKSR